MKIRKNIVALICACLVVGGRIYAADTFPSRINGSELSNIRGWLAGVYSTWPFVPEQSGVWPVPTLWTPSSWDEPVPQSPLQTRLMAARLDAYGSGADVLSFDPDPVSGNLNTWKQVYFVGIEQTKRPFFLLYEHVSDRFTSHNDAAGNPYYDMSDPYNRALFQQDIEFMLREVIVPYSPYYVTINGRAVIYMWATNAMQGDFASLLEEIKAKYPVSFIGSETHVPSDMNGIARWKALDGFMAYSVLDPNNQGDYVRMTTSYYELALSMRQFLRKLEVQTPGRHWLFVTVQGVGRFGSNDAAA